jgi:hypothetical protein
VSPSSRPSRAALDELKKAQQAKERRTRFAFVAGIAVVVLVIAGVVGVTIVRDVSSRPTLDAVKTYEVTANHVTTPVKYAQSPPAGGDHNAVWLNCGIYTEPVPNENAVHALEHGAVWVTYRPDLPADQVKTLTESVPGDYMVVSPYPGLSAPVVASAWGKQLTLTGVDDPRLEQFIRDYRQGPQTPEPGAACTGGTDGTDAAAVTSGASATPTP